MSKIHGDGFTMGDQIVINGIAYQYQGVLSKSGAGYETYVICHDNNKFIFKLYNPNFKPNVEILEIEHENIMHILDYGYHNERFFEMMEYSESESLEKYLPIKDISKVIKIVAQAVNAFEFCHDQGIIFNDIRPDNLYFKNIDNTDIFIGGFDISTKSDTYAFNQTTLTHFNVDYAAPEMYGFDGKAIIGKEVDYYALGITIMHIWKGKSPFEGLSIYDVSTMTASGKIMIPEDMPVALQILVKGLITADYTKRWGYDETQNWLKENISMSGTKRSDGKTISSGVGGGDTGGTKHAGGEDISSGFGPTPGGTSHAGGPDISSGHGPSPASAGISLKAGDPLVINSVTYQYEGVISKTTGEAEIFLLSQAGKKCVFKLYYPNFKPKDDIVKKLKQINHEDIINVIDYGYYHDRFFEIMDYAEGGTIEKYLPIKDIKRIKQIITETINAFKFCHGQGIIHKDIKPQNLYYKNVDGTDILIGDFGISTQLEAGMSRHLTKQDLTVGYAAPEMYGVDGKVYVGREVDYYALGITLMHIWEGRSPFDGLGIHAIANLTTSGKINIPDDMPKELQKLIKGLITVDYVKRWGHDEVRRWLNGEDVPVHFQIKEITYPPYQFGPNEAATTAEELAAILKKKFDIGKKHLYSGKLSAWVNIFNQGLAVELDRIVEDDYPKDQDAGLQKAIYILNPDEPFVQEVVSGASGNLKQRYVESRTTGELADILEERHSQYITELTNANHPFYLYLEAHDEKNEAETFRKYFKTFSAKKALNTIILELRGRDKFKIGDELIFVPEELLKYKDQQFLVKELKDTESMLSLWIEGSGFDDIKKQVDKWRKLNTHDEVTIVYALEKGSPFYLNNSDKAYSENDFVKLFTNNISNQSFVSDVIEGSKFAIAADYWLKNYCGWNYDQLVKDIFTDHYDEIEYHALIPYFMKNRKKSYSVDSIASIIEKAYSEGKLAQKIYIMHKLYLIKDVENKVFNKSITDLNKLWSTDFEVSDIDKWTAYFMKLAQQLIVKLMGFVSKKELSDMKALKIPSKNNLEEVLGFIENLLKITTNTTAKNVTNVHYVNALQIFSEPVKTDMPQRSPQSLLDELDTAHQNIRRAIPTGLFCISLDVYQKYVNGDNLQVRV